MIDIIAIILGMLILAWALSASSRVQDKLFFATAACLMVAWFVGAPA